jgi:hypothetical protein
MMDENENLGIKLDQSISDSNQDKSMLQLLDASEHEDDEGIPDEASPVKTAAIEELPEPLNRELTRSGAAPLIKTAS